MNAQRLETTIRYFGRPAKVACDSQCGKAWGLNSRPKVQLSEDEDDVAYLADDELGTAPADPGTYEGGEGKPSSAEYFPNRWCVRECERSVMSKMGHMHEPLQLDDWSRRVYNQPDKHPELLTETVSETAEANHD